MNELESAIKIAVNAHEGDTDKGGNTYIRHPLRLMEQMDTQQERVVAVLHDVVEDSAYQLETIEDSFGVEISEAVSALTKSDEADYLEEYIPELATNPLARKVKKADLRDNLDITRLSDVAQSDIDNLQKYHRSLQKLRDIETNNHSESNRIEFEFAKKPGNNSQHLVSQDQSETLCGVGLRSDAPISETPGPFDPICGNCKNYISDDQMNSIRKHILSE